MGYSVKFLGIILFVAIIVIIGVVISFAMSRKQPKVATEEDSYFDGGYFAFIGYNLLVVFVTTITLGLAFPWMCCLLERWKAKHTIICGKRKVFNGTGIQLIGKFLLWGFLTIITFGIYGFWMSLSIKKWITKHTHFVGEEDNNSYFDGGIFGFIGTNILAAIVTFVPFVGFAWANVIKLKWFNTHTVVDSRRLVFVGTTGQFFLKYLVWGLLTTITLGVFGLFVPVKNLKLEAENIIDHEHTNKALMKRSEYRNKVQNTMSAGKNMVTEFEMELLRAGINDTTDQDTLRSFADQGIRSAQYLYCIKYANEDYTAEPYSSMLKASAESGYAPAMCLYALTHELEETYKNDLLAKSAEQGVINAIKKQINYCADKGLTESDLSLAEPLIEQAVFYADVLQASAESLTEQEQQIVKKCVLKLREIASGKAPSSKVGAGVIAAVIAILGIIIVLITCVLGLFMPARSMSGPRKDEITNGNMTAVEAVI